MQKYFFTGDFAGIPITFSFRHPDTSVYFNNWLKESYSKKNQVQIPKSDCDCWIKDYGMKDDGNTEFGMSVYRVSDVLLKYDRCIIHSAAMMWRNKAWLFAADSGTGKSTQISHWNCIYADEMRIINGDKPILKLERTGEITVHPSPWKGKEEWGDDSLVSTLGGIIILKQGKKNTIEKVQPVGCAARLLSLFFSSFEEEKTIKSLCRFEEKILNTVPVWKLTNAGNKESAILTHQTLLEWCTGNE